MFALINYHIESYRAFLAVNSSVGILTKDKKLRESFLRTHFGYNSNLGQQNGNFNYSPSNDNNSDDRERIFLSKQEKVGQSSSLDQKWIKWSPSRNKRFDRFDIEKLNRDVTNKCDSFHWMNRVIKFFWPYLSHVVHYELNEFFREQIDSGNLARSNEELKKLFYAILKQLDTNILVIEKCQLGYQAPIIKDLSVLEEDINEDNQLKCSAGKSNTTTATTTQDFFLAEGNKGISVKTNKVSGKKEARAKIKREGNSINRSSGRQTNSTVRIMTKKNTKQVELKQQQQQLANKKEKFLVYNVNLEYNGDMNIAVIYKYFCCLSSRFGLKDVFLHFKLRFILGPIKENIPFIDQVSITLLELPQFGYKGIALAELAELKIVRGVINRLITKNLLYPRFVRISLHELLDTLINGPKTREQRQELKLRREQKVNVRDRTDSGVSAAGSNKANAEVPIWTRFYANTLLFGCICSNFLLRSCQSMRKTATTNDEQSDVKRDETNNNKSLRSRRKRLPPSDTFSTNLSRLKQNR